MLLSRKVWMRRGLKCSRRRQADSWPKIQDPRSKIILFVTKASAAKVDSFGAPSSGLRALGQDCHLESPCCPEEKQKDEKLDASVQLTKLDYEPLERSGDAREGRLIEIDLQHGARTH